MRRFQDLMSTKGHQFKRKESQTSCSVMVHYKYRLTKCLVHFADLFLKLNKKPFVKWLVLLVFAIKIPNALQKNESVCNVYNSIVTRSNLHCSYQICYQMHILIRVLHKSFSAMLSHARIQYGMKARENRTMRKSFGYK